MRILAIVLFLAACGAKKPAATPANSAPAGGSAAAAAPEPVETESAPADPKTRGPMKKGGGADKGADPCEGGE
jgi:hypothetical protein